MTKYKFRAWDTRTKQMRTSFGVHNESGFAFTANMVTAEVEFQHDWIVMLSTGLLDKNGTEIFEGDIVRYDWYTEIGGRTYEIIWFKGALVQKLIDSEYNIIEDKWDTTEMVVIGNIYQNPEFKKEVLNV